MWHLGKKTLSFLGAMYNQVFLKKSFVFTDDSLLQDANKVFRIILVVVLSKIALNEKLLNKDSDFIREGIAQLFILIIYFFLFQLNYYYAKLLAHIKKDERVKAIYLTLWQFYTLTSLFLIIIFSSSEGKEFDPFDIPFKVFFVYLAHSIYLFFKFSFRHKAILIFFTIVSIFISVFISGVLFNMIINFITN